MKQLFIQSKYGVAIIILFSLCVVMCKKNALSTTERSIDPPTTNDKEQVAITEPFRPVILGEKLENPFSVENMQKALNQIKKENSQTLITAGINNPSAVDELTIYPTDLYVRFLPADSAQQNTLLQDTTLILTTTPLDYEIVQSGDYYKDSSLTGEYTWLYTTVKTDYVPPQGIRYEVLSKLFIPEHSSQYEELPIDDSNNESLNIQANTKSSKALNRNMINTLIIQSFVLTGNSKQLALPVEEKLNTGIQAKTEQRNCKNHRFLWWRWTSCDVVYYPDGYIRVHTPNGEVGVKGVEVQVWRWFYSGRGRTNANGYYQISKDFNSLWIGNSMNYTVHFNGAVNGHSWTLDRSLFGLIPLWTTSYNAGYHHPNGFSMTFYDNSGSWGRCVLNNAIYDYITMNIPKYGLAAPPRNLQLAVKQVSDITEQSLSTPLLRNHVGPLTAILVLTPIVNMFTYWGWPDMILRYPSYNTLPQYNSTYHSTWHELVHASQVERMKQERGYWWASGYWGLLAFQEFSNDLSSGDPYKNKGDKNWELIALVEGWAYFMEWTMARDILKSNNIFNYKNDYLDRPRRFEEREFPITYGEMYRQLIELGCSYSNIEKSLSTYSIEGFKNNLIGKYPYWSAQITNIINPYE